MVDFQSRDTKRGIEDEDEEDGEPATKEPDPASDEPAVDEPETATEPAESSTPDEAGVAVVTVGGDLEVEEDEAGAAVVAALEGSGSQVVTREILAPDYDGVQSAVDAVAGRADVAAVVTVGGTGVGPEDVTVEAVRPLFDRELPGFGELVRLLAHDEVGSDVVSMRPTAGLIDAVPVFCLPGEVWAAELACEAVVLDQVEPLVEQAQG